MKQIPLTQGRMAIVDDCDVEWLNRWKWHTNNQHGVWYAINREKGRMHKLIMNSPKHTEVDHINGDGLDNRRCNLRVCTRSENMQNQKPQKNRSSQYKGVVWDKRYQRWFVSIKHNQKIIFIGRFNNEEQAALAYNKKAKEIFGNFSRPNKI